MEASRTTLQAVLTRPTIRASGGSLLAAFIGQFSLMLSGIATARALGPEGRGEFAIATIVTGVVATIVAMGTDVGIAYAISKTPTSAGRIAAMMAPTLSTQMVISILVSYFTLYFWLPDQINTFILCLLLSIVTASIVLRNYCLSVMQGLQTFLLFNLFRSLAPLIPSLSLFVALALGTKGTSAVLLVWTSANLASTCAIGVATLRLLRGHRGYSMELTTKEIRRFGLAGFLGSSTPLETFRIDQLFLYGILSTSQLGIYATANSLTNFPRFISQSLGMVAYPTVARATNKQSAARTALRFVLSTTVLVLALVSLVAFLAQWLVPLLFGAEFKSAVGITEILLFAAVFQAFRRIVTECMRGMGFTISGSVAELLSWAVLVPSLAYLANKEGTAGVAIAVALSSVASGTVSGITFWHAHKLHSRSIR